MSDDKTLGWHKQFRLDDRVIVEYEDGIIRKKKKILEGRVRKIGRYIVEIVPGDESVFDKSTLNYLGIPYDLISRVKNFDTDYDSGEPHE